MKINFNLRLYKNIYIFFVFLSLFIFFFSTAKVEAKAFKIDNIEITKPFEINFDKNIVIDAGFKKAFSELISLIVDSENQKKINLIRLNQIKGMIESFSIKEEKFINEIYFVKLDVSFNKKKVFEFLEKKNIFPSIPTKKKILFIPIIINEKDKDLLIFSNNKIYDKWNINNERHHLIEYILPTADLEDLNTIKDKFDSIENYDFKEISKKYFLNDSIIALIFKNQKELRILSRITIKDNINLKNQTFSNIDLNNEQKIQKVIDELKTIYEDYWKNSNLINTSIKLILKIKVKNLDNQKISNFDKILNKNDLIYDFFISKIDKDYIYYQVTFNGTPNMFLKSMSEDDYSFNTQNKIWILQ